jgi:flagellar protein FlbD
MIELTRLNGHSIVVNSDLIRYAESSPDTVLTLVTGEKLIVREPALEVARRVNEFRAAVLREAWPEASTAFSARAAHSFAHSEHAPFFPRD